MCSRVARKQSVLYGIYQTAILDDDWLVYISRGLTMLIVISLKINDVYRIKLIGRCAQPMSIDVRTHHVIYRPYVE